MEVCIHLFDHVPHFDSSQRKCLTFSSDTFDSSYSSSSILNHSRLAHLRSLDFVYAAAADYDDDVVVDEEGGAAGVADGDDFGEMIQAKLAVPAGFKVSEPQKETRHDHTSSGTIQEKMLTIILNYL